MKPFALLILGVVVGLAVSGIDWSREAVGETSVEAGSRVREGEVIGTIKDQNDADAPKRPPLVGANEGPTVRLPLDLDADHPASSSPQSRQSLAEDGFDQMGRYIPVPDAAGQSSGCYIVDSITGRTWHATDSGIRELQKRAP